MNLDLLVNSMAEAHAKWLRLQQQRPGEVGSLQEYLGSEMTMGKVADKFESLLESVRTLAGKPRVSRSLPKGTSDALAQVFAGLNRTMDHAFNSGIDWMFNTRGFATNYVLAGLLVQELTSHVNRETAALSDAAKERLETNLASLQAGELVAADLLDKKDAIQEQVERLEKAAEDVSTILDAIQKTSTEAQESIRVAAAATEELSTLSVEQIGSAQKEYHEKLTEAKEALEVSLGVKGRLTSLLGEAKQKRESAAEQWKEATDLLQAATADQEAAKQRLTKALQSVQMEGLAGSFTQKADETAKTIQIEQTRFERALVYLVLVGVLSLVVELNFGATKSWDEFYFRLIRTLSIAAPGIWVAWVTSRRLGALNRILSDYQYKSASALAYESYRQTVAEAGDDQLKAQLLSFAIKSFGENPTRYFDSARDEAVSPADSLLGKIFSRGKAKADLSS